MLRAEQLIHQRSVHSGPLVLGANLLKFLRLQQIGDQPVSRMILNCFQLHGLNLPRQINEAQHIVSTGICRKLDMNPEPLSYLVAREVRLDLGTSSPRRRTAIARPGIQ